MNKNKLTYLLGYRAKGIGLYKTELKPLGKVIKYAGITSLIVAVIPNGLGVLFYPLGFGLLGLVGINMDLKKKFSHHYTMFKYKRGLL